VYSKYSNPNDFPSPEVINTKVDEIQEPFVLATITTPEEYIGKVIEICEASRGEQLELTFFTASSEARRPIYSNNLDIFDGEERYPLGRWARRWFLESNE
jgi:translation elongation factor EF-4